MDEHRGPRNVPRGRRTAAQMVGDLLEIGAFEGRSAVVVGGMAAPGQAVHVCDPFDSADGDERNQARTG